MVFIFWVAGRCLADYKNISIFNPLCKFTHILIVLVIVFPVRAQNYDPCDQDLPYNYIPYARGLFLNLNFKKDEVQTERYKKEIPYYYSASFFVYPDSTYLYYHYSPQFYWMSAGRYISCGTVFTFNWDSLKTEQITNSPEFYEQYFKYGKPKALPLHQVRYELKDAEMKTYVPESKKNSIGLLMSPDDLYKRVNELDSFSFIKYNMAGDRIRIGCGHKEMEFRADSIWGFIIQTAGESKVYRRVKKNLNWYGLPGLQIVQKDLFVLYTAGQGRMYSFFSVDLNSEIYPLKQNDLSTVFKNNSVFVKELSSQFGLRTPLHALDEFYNSYKVMEVYRASLTPQKPLNSYKRR